MKRSVGDYIVHIIESPKPRELLDGRAERDALGSVLRQLGIRSEVYLVTDGQTFGTALGRVVESAKEGKVPVLHLSVHANEEVLGLTDGTGTEWKNIAPVLALINSAVGGQLILCMSACHGIAAHRTIQTSKDHAFGTLVGPSTVVEWQDSLVAFVAFYQHLVRRRAAVDVAVSQMNAAAGLAASTFQWTTGDAVRASRAKAEQEAKWNELGVQIAKLAAQLSRPAAKP